MDAVQSHVCSATSVRQTFFHTGRETVISHWPSSWLPNNSSFLTTAWRHCGSREGNKEALVSILNHFVCPLPSLLLFDLFTFSRGTKMEHSVEECSTEQPCIPICPLARTWWAKPSTLLSRFSLLLRFLALAAKKPGQGQRQPWAFSLLLALLGVWQEVGQWVPWQWWNVKVTLGKTLWSLKRWSCFRWNSHPHNAQLGM